MLRSYFPIYQIALQLQEMKYRAELLSSSDVTSNKEFKSLLEDIQRACLDIGLTHTSELAKRIQSKPNPKKNSQVFSALDSVNDSLTNELEKESIFRIPPDRRGYFEQDELFGAGVAAAFPSCARDIQRAGSCYALEQEDACVHHLMLVLERGLHALAVKVGVQFQHANWQVIINEITARLKHLPKGKERDFYNEVTAQFGFLKVAYRNHSEHARDDFYDMEKARSILNHVRAFMQELERGGLSE